MMADPEIAASGLTRYASEGDGAGGTEKAGRKVVPRMMRSEPFLEPPACVAHWIWA